MLRKLFIAPCVISFLFIAGCASEDPMMDELGDEGIEEGVEEGVIGDAVATTGDGSPSPDALLPAYCNGVNSWNATWADWENQVLTLVNQKRAAGATCGGTVYPPAPPLAFHESLRCSARVHSKDMGDKNFFSHTGSNGSTFSQRITQAGYSWSGAGENIGAGYSSPSAAVNGWMASSGHCSNIMNKSYTHLGTGYYNAATSTYKHYWTQSLAKPL